MMDSAVSLLDLASSYVSIAGLTMVDFGWASPFTEAPGSTQSLPALMGIARRGAWGLLIFQLWFL